MDHGLVRFAVNVVRDVVIWACKGRRGLALLVFIALAVGFVVIGGPIIKAINFGPGARFESEPAVSSQPYAPAPY